MPQGAERDRPAQKPPRTAPASCKVGQTTMPIVPRISIGARKSPNTSEIAKGRLPTNTPPTTTPTTAEKVEKPEKTAQTEADRVAMWTT